MPAQRTGVDEMRSEWQHRRTVKYVLRDMPIEDINQIFEWHSATTPFDDREMFLDAINNYLDQWYLLPR